MAIPGFSRFKSKLMLPVADDYLTTPGKAER